MLAPLLVAVLLAQAPEPPRPPAPPPRAAAPAPRSAVRATPAIPPAPRASGPLRGEWPAAPSGKRVTLEDTTSLDDALDTIAREAGWNAVLNTGRTGNIQLVLRLRAVPVEDALRAALAGTGLVATRTGDTVVVAPAEEPPAAAAVLSGFDRPTGKRFTGDFDDDDVSDALRKLSDAAGLSIVLPPGDLGNVTAHFKDAPVEDALRAVLSQAGLSAARDGALLTVTPARGLRGLRGLPPGLPPGISADALRKADEAVRNADRALHRGRSNGPRDRVVHGDLSLEPGQQAHDLVAIRGDVRLKPGSEAHNVVAVLGTVTLEAGARAKEVTAVGGDVQIGPGAEVEGNATSVGGQVKADPGGEIGGEQTSIGIPELSGLGAIAGGSSWLFGESHSPLFRLGQVLAKFAMYFALGLVLLVLFPRRLEAVAGSMTASPGRSILAGVLGTVAMPLLAILLIATIVGILLLPVQLLAVLAAGVLGFTALSFHIGRALPIQIQRGAAVLQLAVGTAIVVLVSQIPFLGSMAWIAGWLLVFGAVLRSRFGSQGPILTTTVAPPPSPPAPAPR